MISYSTCQRCLSRSESFVHVVREDVKEFWTQFIREEDVWSKFISTLLIMLSRFPPPSRDYVGDVSNDSWLNPPPNCFKLNSDGSMLLSWYLDTNGCFVRGYFSKVSSSNVIWAEFRAHFLALKVARVFGISGSLWKLIPNFILGFIFYTLAFITYTPIIFYF